MGGGVPHSGDNGACKWMRDCRQTARHPSYLTTASRNPSFGHLGMQPVNPTEGFVLKNFQTRESKTESRSELGARRVQALRPRAPIYTAVKWAPLPTPYQVQQMLPAPQHRLAGDHGKTYEAMAKQFAENGVRGYVS